MRGDGPQMVLTETTKNGRDPWKGNRDRSKEINKMNFAIPTDGGQPQTIGISTIRQRGFAMAKSIIAELAFLDERIGFATEMTVDDRNAMLESARRLSLLLLDGEVSQ